MEVRCRVRSCLLLWASQSSSTTDRALEVDTASRWSWDQTSGCSPQTADKSGTTGSRRCGTSSGPVETSSSDSGSVLITTFVGGASEELDGPAVAMFVYVPDVRHRAGEEVTLKYFCV